MFPGKAGTYLSEASIFQVLSSRIGSMAYPHMWMKVEKLANDKHSSLLRKVVNYGFKKFITLDSGCISHTIKLD